MGKTKKKIQVPQILVLIMLLILVFCALSYIVPGGEFQLDDNKRAIAGTFQFVGQNPVSPWQALLSIKKGIVGSASTISLLLICGGSLAVVISTGCFEEMINYGIYRLEDKSVIVLVPAIVTLMSLLGAFAGNDSMIAFVTVGLVICSRLKLDRICAMSMFYLGYLIGQGASFTSTLLITVQSICEVTPLSGMQVRIIIWIIFTAIHAAYCTHYALKITKNPLRSITGVLTKPEEQGEKKETKFPIRAFVNMITLFSCYIIYAFGSKNYGWENDYLVALMVVDGLFTAVIYQVNPNEVGKRFFKGAQGMGGICVVLGFAKVIGTILTDSKMVNTIAHGASTLFGGFGPMVAALAIFAFILFFNMLIPSGYSKAAILLPLVCPVGDVLGVTREIIAQIYCIGDSLTNTLTPVSSPLVGALGLAEVEYTDWLKYAVPLMGILIGIASVIICILSGIGWVG